MGYATAAGGSADDARQYAEAASTSAVNADASAKRAEEIAGGLGSYDGTAASVTAVDTHDFTGTGAGKKSTVQALLDKITQKLIEKVVTSDTFQQVLAKYLVNNGLTTEAGKFGLDAAYGKNLQDQITEQNSNITEIQNQYAALNKENHFNKPQKIYSDTVPCLEVVSGSSGSVSGAFTVTARTDVNEYSRASISLINNSKINGTLFLDLDGFLYWSAHGNTYKINMTQQ